MEMRDGFSFNLVCLEHYLAQIGWQDDMREVHFDLLAADFALHLDLVLDHGIPGEADVRYSLFVEGVKVVDK